jgi:hypothetical protein
MAIMSLPRINTHLKAGLMVVGSGAAGLAMVIGIPICWAYVPFSSVLTAALLWFAGRESLREGEPGPPFGVNSAGSLGFTVGIGVWAYACGAKLSLFFESHPQAFAPDGVFACNLWALAGCVAGVVLWDMTESFIEDLRMRHRMMVESCLSKARASQWIALRLSVWTASALLCAATVVSHCIWRHVDCVTPAARATAPQAC